MFEKILNNNDLFEASNSFLSLKFYKEGKNQGKFDILNKKDIHNECSLRDCYSAINFYSKDSTSISEFSSLKYRYESKINFIEDSFGKGLNIVFTPLNIKENDLFFELSFTLYENCEFILIKLINIKDNTGKSLAVHSISPLTIRESKLWLSGKKTPTDLQNITWFKNGWESWSPCETLYGTEKDHKGPSTDVFKVMYDNQDYKIEGRFYSEYCTVISDLESKNSAIIGFVTLKEQFSRIILDYETSPSLRLLTAFGCMDGVKFKDSSINSSEELFICFKSNNLGYYGLIDYAKVVKVKMVKNRINVVPIGWCSWYYYFTNITQDEVVKNLNYFKEHKDNIPIDFFQLDDGYFTEIGDYSSLNEKFPNSLEWLFSQIKEAEYMSGIWTAPFFAVRKSQIFKNHKEWFLRKDNNLIKTCYNWGAFEFGLDLSNKQVLNYLKNFYSKTRYAYSEEASLNKKTIIDFLKIDFVYAATPFEANYSDKTLTRAQIYYNGVKTIRDAIGDDIFLLGCGAPIGPSIGLVDAMRIGYDTGPLWEGQYFERFENGRGLIQPCLKIALNNVLFRSFMHRNFWINDPDCLMIRHQNTKLNFDEIQLQITIFGLSGGQILLSEDMTKLSEEEINDFKLLLPAYNPEGYLPIPVDALTSKKPSIFMLETNEPIGKKYLVAIINWNDEASDKSLKISELILNLPEKEDVFFVYDYWNQKFVGEFKKEGIIKIKDMKAHSCVYLSIIPIQDKTKGKSVLLSSDLHISQGCYEIKNVEFRDNYNKIKIEIELKGFRKGHLYLKLPSNKNISKYNSDYSKIDKNNNIWRLKVEFKDKTSLNIDLT
jgi:alpha-galactosidase